MKKNECEKRGYHKWIPSDIDSVFETADTIELLVKCIDCKKEARCDGDWE